MYMIIYANCRYSKNQRDLPMKPMTFFFSGRFLKTPFKVLENELFSTKNLLNVHSQFDWGFTDRYSIYIHLFRINYIRFCAKHWGQLKNYFNFIFAEYLAWIKNCKHHFPFAFSFHYLNFKIHFFQKTIYCLNVYRDHNNISVVQTKNVLI